MDSSSTGSTRTSATVDLYWMPVGAGTSRLQQASLRLWEAFEAARARRPRARLVHCALKLRPDNTQVFTLELTPAFIGADVPPLATGPVGFHGADRFRLFRYQLRCLSGDALPDEQWAIGSPIPLSRDPHIARRILDLARDVPAHTWGRRVPGTNEMWTSDSIIAWLLARAGLDLSTIAPPEGCRAAGWFSGIELARRDAPG